VIIFVGWASIRYRGVSAEVTADLESGCLFPAQGFQRQGALRRAARHPQAAQQNLG
jgi:hypothetical protein